MLWSDGRHCGGRFERLYFAKGGQAHKFSGETIPGVAVVVGSSYNKNGKWSSTTYKLELAPGVAPVRLCSPLHGTWGETLTGWAAAMAELGLPYEATREIVLAEYPKTAARLDAVEAALEAIETTASDSEIVSIAFGAPTNRQAAEGYWGAIKVGATSTGNRVEIAPGTEPDGAIDWNNPVVVAPAGAAIVGVRHSPGHHGGYWHVDVACPA